AHDEVVKRERKLDDGIESGEGPVTRPHLLHHDAAVSAGEDMYHLSAQNGFRKPVRGTLDERLLLAGALEQLPAGFEIAELRRRHHNWHPIPDFSQTATAKPWTPGR